MRSKFKKILPWIALAGIIFAAILFILTSTNRSKSLGDSPETQAAASQAASRLIEMHPSDPAETAFLQAAKQAARQAYITQVWLF